MKRIIKTAVSIVSACLMISPLSAYSSSEKIPAGDIDYTISDPYASVDWEDISQYKTALHTHTNASDGDDTIKQSLERHLETGFDIVATTDHGTVNRSWAEKNYSKFIYSVMKAVGRTEGELDYLGKSGAFAKGAAYEIIENDNGDEILKTESGRQMLRIPYGIENGAVSVNAHVNSWFAEYQDNSVCDYERTIKGVSKAGALCVINHPGEYTKAKEDLKSSEAYHSGHWAYRYYINKFYGLVDKYDCCIGIDMNSKGDSRTRYDRELWDIMLERRTPSGKNVFAIASSDAHQLNKIDTGFTYLLMDELDSAKARESLESGSFFAASHCNGNYLELVSIADALERYYGETPLLSSIRKVIEEMETRVNGVYDGPLKANTDLGVTYNCLDDDGYCAAQTQPMITGISVDEAEDSITVNTKDALIVRWIANGECIAVTKADEGVSTIDLDDYSEKIGTYVRAEAFGEGGTVYTQAFVLSYDGQPQPQSYPYLNIPVIDFLFAEIRNIGNIISRSFHS